VKLNTYFQIQPSVKKEWSNIFTPLFLFTASYFLVLTLVLTNILRILGTWNPTVGDIYGFYTWLDFSESIRADGRTSGIYCLPNNTPGVGLAWPVQLWATEWTTMENSRQVQEIFLFCKCPRATLGPNHLPTKCAPATLSQQVKWSRGEPDRSLPSTMQVENGCSCISALSCAFMSCAKRLDSYSFFE